MREKKITLAIKIILILGSCTIGITLMYIYEGKSDSSAISTPVPQVDTIEQPSFYSKTAKEGLKEALVFYNIQYPEIVYAQAVLETGHFRSQGCLRDNNLFGLYNSRDNRYHKFDHWTENVVKYKEWIQKRYKPPEDYYHFLKRIGYASDPQYINKLRNIVRYESKRSKGVSVATDTTVTR